jgi:hypothetical protein
MAQSEQVFHVFADLAEVPPCAFSTMKEAEMSMVNIRNRAVILGRILGQNLILNGHMDEKDQQAVDQILKVQRSWLRALNDLEDKMPLSKQDTTTASTLKAQYYCLYLVTLRAMGSNETSFDQHLDIFKALLHHSKIAVTSMEQTRSRSAAAFTFDLGIILGIYMTACRCRCPSTRREAIALLERDLPREGLWDAKQHFLVARRIIELEESELDRFTGWPSERARVWSVRQAHVRTACETYTDFVLGTDSWRCG